jgi:hypothetical protein
MLKIEEKETKEAEKDKPSREDRNLEDLEDLDEFLHEKTQRFYFQKRLDGWKPKKNKAVEQIQKSKPKKFGKEAWDDFIALISKNHPKEIPPPDVRPLSRLKTLSEHQEHMLQQVYHWIFSLDDTVAQETIGKCVDIFKEPFLFEIPTEIPKRMDPTAKLREKASRKYCFIVTFFRVKV